jgi:hypothetical protein
VKEGEREKTKREKEVVVMRKSEGGGIQSTRNIG